MGRVEFGSRTGSQFAAGRSYHGVDGSPCMAGMTQGVVFAAFAILSAGFSSPLPFCGSSSLDEGPSSTAFRSCSTKPSEKYRFSSHRLIKSRILRMCFGQLWKAAALLTRAGSDGSSFWAKASSRLRCLTWKRTSFRTYRMWRRRRLADGTRAVPDAGAASSLGAPRDLERATKYLQKGAMRADEGTRLLRAHCLHLWRAA